MPAKAGIQSNGAPAYAGATNGKKKPRTKSGEQEESQTLHLLNPDFISQTVDEPSKTCRPA